MASLFPVPAAAAAAPPSDSEEEEEQKKQKKKKKKRKHIPTPPPSSSDDEEEEEEIPVPKKKKQKKVVVEEDSDDEVAAVPMEEDTPTPAPPDRVTPEGGRVRLSGRSELDLGEWFLSGEGGKLHAFIGPWPNSCEFKGKKIPVIPGKGIDWLRVGKKDFFHSRECQVAHPGDEVPLTHASGKNTVTLFEDWSTCESWVWGTDNAFYLIDEAAWKIMNNPDKKGLYATEIHGHDKTRLNQDIRKNAMGMLNVMSVGKKDDPPFIRVGGQFQFFHKPFIGAREVMAKGPLGVAKATTPATAKPKPLSVEQGVAAVNWVMSRECDSLATTIMRASRNQDKKSPQHWRRDWIDANIFRKYTAAAADFDVKTYHQKLIDNTRPWFAKKVEQANMEPVEASQLDSVYTWMASTAYGQKTIKRLLKADEEPAAASAAASQEEEEEEEESI